MVNDDLRRLFEDGDPPAVEPGEDGAFEVDLSDALDEMGPAEPPTASPAVSAESEPDTLDGFFRGLREQAGDQNVEAERLCVEGEADLAGGQIEKAIAAFRAAARVPAFRTRASRSIARIAREQGDLGEAVDWLERAVEVPVETPAEAHELLYELADTLVAAGEEARALAVFMELQSSAAGFRDVEQRIAELSERRSQWARPRSGGTA